MDRTDGCPLVTRTVTACIKLSKKINKNKKKNKNKNKKFKKNNIKKSLLLFTDFRYFNSDVKDKKKILIMEYDEHRQEIYER